MSDDDSPLIRCLERSRQFGFLGPGEIAPHLGVAQRFRRVLESRTDVRVRTYMLDLGAGGGIPGLALAYWGVGSEWVFLDANTKRCEFLESAISELHLSSHVSVRLGRAEVLGRDSELRHMFDVVVARGFGPPPVLAECAAPFLSTGGIVLVSEPTATPLRWEKDGLVELGLSVSPCDEPYLACLESQSFCSDRYPRRTGVPAKRPLF